MRDRLTEVEEEIPDAPGTSDKRKVSPVDTWVGSRLRLLRASRGLTARALADQIAVSVPSVEKWEMGKIRMTAGRIYDVSQALGVSPAALFQGFPMATEHESLGPDIGRLGSPEDIRALIEINSLLPKQKAALHLIISAFQVENAATMNGQRVIELNDD